MTKRFLPSACSLLYLSWTIFTSPSCSQNDPAQTCDPGWFGSNCQYKCRCRGSTCDREGVCSDGVCASGWFGPGCQYEDLTTSENTSNSRAWLHDGDGLTCGTSLDLEPLDVIMPVEFPFTWLRLQVRDPLLLHAFHVTFFDLTNKNTLMCKKMRTAVVSNNTLDIHCDLDVLVRGVFLRGDGIKSLCSLYISGGRNVALRQNTTQSSTLVYSKGDRSPLHSAPMNAVDGNRSNDYALDSCTHTQHGDPSPTWIVTLSSAFTINKYVLYNRNSRPERLIGFTLTSFTNDHKMVFNYTDRETTAHQVYTITSGLKTSPVSEVNIRAYTYNVSEPILTLCEVELYGDTACPPSRYGRECEHTCNCAVKDESCFVSTGGCPSGCAAGFQGEGCDKSCDFGKYGLGCSSNCSQFCVQTNISRPPCFPTNGTCIHGCVNGYWDSECDNFPGTVYGGSSVAFVIYILIAFVILVAVVVLGVVLWRRRRLTPLKQKPNTVNIRDSHYNQIIDTELNLIITPERNEHKRPINSAKSPELQTAQATINTPELQTKQATINTPELQTKQATINQNESLVNVASSSDDSHYYEEMLDADMKYPTPRDELNSKSPGYCNTTPKQTTQSILTQNKSPGISNSDDSSHYYEEVMDTKLTQTITTGRNELAAKPPEIRPNTSKQPTQNFKIQNKSNDIEYYNTVAGM